jgi:FkbM family methyltransferase
VDGGANIGMSVLLWKYLHPESEILAFEPDPDTCALLERNVSANRLSGVRIVNRALSDAEAPLDFFYNPETPGNLGMSTLADPALKGRHTVQAAMLSSYLSGPMDLFKLDVGGGRGRCRLRAGEEREAPVDRPDRDGVPSSDAWRRPPRGHAAHLATDGFGYQLDAKPCLPFRKHELTPMFLYAYRKPAAAEVSRRRDAQLFGPAPGRQSPPDAGRHPDFE